VLGTGVLIFAILLAQVPGKDRTLDVITFSVATMLLLGCLWLGFFWSKAPYGPAVSGWTKSVLTVMAGIEVALAVYGAVGALTYRGL
jgi:hypothetical protein